MVNSSEISGSQPEHETIQNDKSLESDIYIETNDYFEREGGRIIVRDQAIQRPPPTLIQREEKDVTPHNPPSHPTFKISYIFLFDDGSQSYFIPIKNTVLFYESYLKDPTPFPRGIAATPGYSEFIGEYGGEYITFSIPTPVWEQLVNLVIQTVKGNNSISLDRNWENRFRNKDKEVTRLNKLKINKQVKEGHSVFYANMDDDIPGSTSQDVTAKMKKERADACGIGQVGIHLSQVRNSYYTPYLWQLKFTIYRLEKEEYRKLQI